MSRSRPSGNTAKVTSGGLMATTFSNRFGGSPQHFLTLSPSCAEEKGAPHLPRTDPTPKNLDQNFSGLNKRFAQIVCLPV